MTATGIRMTADELFRLPDNGKRYELEPVMNFGRALP